MRKDARSHDFQHRLLPIDIGWCLPRKSSVRPFHGWCGCSLKSSGLESVCVLGLSPGVAYDHRFPPEGGRDAAGPWFRRASQRYPARRRG